MVNDTSSFLKNHFQQKIEEVVVRRKDETMAGCLRRVRDELVARTPQADRTQETLR